jgi:glycosyltransferase involved in cell wall biosynthesis/GT2 family glycosyltransferase
MSQNGPVAPNRPTVSVVIATAGRRQCLPKCIASLRRQTYTAVELVLVVGPSKDGSYEYASSLTDVKVTRVDRLNASFARNTGVRLASGDIIAFIDDDAIATPSWLEELVRVFEAEGPTCGGVAGLVVNENGPGRPVQAMNNTINDMGDPIECRIAPSGFNDPDGNEFTYFMGANMAVRREAFLAVGGFDETYLYPYEDADLCVAIIKAGYRLFHHPRAVVHHLPALSHNRRSAFDPNYFAGARHQWYFALKFSKKTNRECFRAVVRFHWYVIPAFIQMARHKKITHRDAARFSWNTIRGVASGLKVGLRYRRQGRVPSLSPALRRPELRALTIDPPPRPPRRRQRSSLRLALLCGEFGSPTPGGVGVYTAHLAEALASRGHDVSVFRLHIGPCQIEPAGYRVVDVPTEADPVRERHAFLMALHREADRREFDLVESPLWAGNGAAVGSAARWPLVVRLETPFALIAEMSGIEYNPFVRTLIAAEQLQLAYATGIIGISRAVVSTVESSYHIPLAYHGRRLTVIPLGLPSVDRIPFAHVETPASDGTKFLYIGRFEARKGVLDLAEAFATLSRQNANATLWIVGADNSANDGYAARTGKTYIQTMSEILGDLVGTRVHFFGRVDDAVKNFLISACDVLVAPSLYESFGLMYVEAMRAGKPVIGTKTGGIPEVVGDGETGLLVPPGDVPALVEAMLRLVADSQLQQAFGHRGLVRFEQRFSLYNFGRESENFYRQVLDEWRGVGASNQTADTNRGRPNSLPNSQLGITHNTDLRQRRPA